MHVKSGLYMCVYLLLSTALVASISSVLAQSEMKDQYQENSAVCEHVDTYWISWQEFVPTVHSLSRVEVKINRYVNYPNQYPITMTIEAPLGSVLTSKTLQWNAVPELPWGQTVWISFDVPDIALTPGQSYYIVLNSTPLAYLWSAANWDAYPPGRSNFDYPWDWTFRTFYVPAGTYTQGFRIGQSSGVWANGFINFTKDGTVVGGPFAVMCNSNYTDYYFDVAEKPNDISWHLWVNWPDGGEDWNGANQPWPAVYRKTHGSVEVVLEEPPPVVVVGGIVLPIDKFGLLAPFIGLASTIAVAAVATAIYVKRVKHRKEIP